MRATNLTSHIRDANSPSLEAFENVRYPFRHSFRGSWRIVLSTTCCNVTVLHLSAFVDLIILRLVAAFCFPSPPLFDIVCSLPEDCPYEY
jgi:hypothetical protein